MKITVGIEVTGTEGEPISFTKSISTTEGEYTNRSKELESDGGTAPVDVTAPMISSESGTFGGTTWIDAGAAPQPPMSSSGNGDARSTSSESDDAGGSSQHHNG